MTTEIIDQLINHCDNVNKKGHIRKTCEDNILNKPKKNKQKRKPYKRNEAYYNDEGKFVMKLYYDLNRDKCYKGKNKYTCECGMTLRKDGKSEHNKTLRHIKTINNIEKMKTEITEQVKKELMAKLGA